MKLGWMSIFTESSNLTLDLLYNGSGYERFSQSVLYIALWSKKNYKKIYLD